VLALFALFGPGGILPAAGAAILLGILCGLSIGWSRQRRERRRA